MLERVDSYQKKQYFETGQKRIHYYKVSARQMIKMRITKDIL